MEDMEKIKEQCSNCKFFEYLVGEEDRLDIRRELVVPNAESPPEDFADYIDRCNCVVSGSCHAHPPVSTPEIGNDGPVFSFAETMQSNWCGEWNGKG